MIQNKDDKSMLYLITKDKGYLLSNKYPLFNMKEEIEELINKKHFYTISAFVQTSYNDFKNEEGSSNQR
ncbi:unnamed protein product [Lactuca virosa]|uniref:Uncharacterized protein n=1 Tax=Lactuca virosa TaxID=75947 RepID=A0AAU9LNT5_9ASTR|nr:unnamed protein product [Lactuca virosa]